jgi:predicted deacylase
MNRNQEADVTPSEGHTVEQLPLFTLANGHRVDLVAHVVTGSTAGPTLGLVAGVHGDEPVSVEIVRRIVLETAPAELAGTIIALPVANPYAVQHRTRNTPLDMQNLNRSMPGDPNGLLTDQLADAICQRFVPRCDALIDLHSGGDFATVDYSYIHDTGADLARAYGREVLFRGAPHAGSLQEYALSRGIPVVLSELGGGQHDNERFVEKGVWGVRNVMRRLGMLSGTAESAPRQVTVDELITLRPHHGGFLYSSVSLGHLGKSVPRGELLGRVVSPYTFEVLEELRAPYDPTILVLVRTSFTTVDPGDYAFMVANGATATPA